MLRMATTSTRCGWSLFTQHSWTDEACFTREGVFNVHYGHLRARDNHHAIRERGYQARFSVSVWADIVGDIVVGPYLLPDRLIAQRYRDFLETVLPGLLENVPLAVRQRLWFQHDGAPAHYGEDVRHWLYATYPVRWIGRGGPIAWPPRSPDLTPMDFFPVGAPEGASLRSPFQDYRRSCGKTSSSCDNGRFLPIKACSRECRAAHCRLPWNGRRPLRTPTVTMRRPRFDHMIACAIWRWRLSWKLNVTGHMLYNIFDLFSNEESHYEELVREFRFAMYILLSAGLHASGQQPTYRKVSDRPSRHRLYWFSSVLKQMQRSFQVATASSHATLPI
jgi:hypothetical protein